MATTKWITIFLLSVALTACGFKLQVSQALPSQLQNVYIDSTQSPHSMVAPELSAALQSDNVNCVSTSQTANITLNITQDKQTSSQMGSGASQETRKYELAYSVTFTLLNTKGKVIYGPTTITSTMMHYVYSGQVLGNNQEEGTLYRSLRRDVVQKIIFKLSSNDVKTALVNNTQ